MRITAVSNQKGGVGKSAITLHTGAALAHVGNRVLLIDWDPQGHLTNSIGVAKLGSGPGDANLAKAVLGTWRGNLSELIRQVDENLYIIPTCDEMFLLEGQMYARTARERLLSRFLDNLAGVVDDVAIDCPPSLGPLNDSALVAARDRDSDPKGVTGRVLIPVEAEDSSLDALRLLVRQIETLQEGLDIELTIAGLVVNMYDSRRGRIATSTLQAFRENPLGVLAVLHQLKEVTESWRENKTVFQHAPESVMTQQFAQLGAALHRAYDPAGNQVTA